MVTITIDTDNAAFEDNFDEEFHWVLSKVYAIDGYSLMDSNGNTVGNVQIS